MLQSLYKLVPEIGEQTGMIDSVIDVQYPHVARKLCLFWGEPEFLIEIDNLLNYSYDPERPVRQGFPPEVFKELYILLDAHRKAFPNVKTDLTHRIDNPWSY